jgi:error-prone DNA polymerase
MKPAQRPPPAYAELAVTTNFSFLEGGSHPEEYAAHAKELGLAAIGIADRNTLAGVVRAHVAARDAGVRLAVGARLVFADGTPDCLAYPRDRAAYGRLTRLLTLGNRRAEKGACHLTVGDLAAHAAGLSLIVLPPPRLDDRFAPLLAHLSDTAPRHVWLGAAVRFDGGDHRRLQQLSALAGAARVPLLAVGDVLYHEPGRRALQDVLTCIRAHTTIEAAGRRLAANAERHLKSPAGMAALFAALPDAIAETIAFLSHITFSLDDLRYEYPDESHAGYANPQAALAALTAQGAATRYPDGVPAAVQATIDHELAIIAGLEYAPYFLTVYDIVQYARSRNILAQGRGSAANSAVCFCLGITEVDPKRGNLLFERFMSPERREPPDIDVDFEHERREEVIQYIYQRYGRERAGLAATVISYRTRSAIRDVGKVFGFSDDTIAALSGTIWGHSSSGVTGTDAARIGLDPREPRLGQALALARTLIGFPRHLSQHVGGFVITRGRLDEVIPVGNAAMDDRTFVEWDKDDLDALGILKIDILALGMLTAIRKSLALLAAHYGQPLTLADTPAEDPDVYAMIQRADTIGVFQIESRAQMTMLPRLKPATFYDLVIEVAIVRPGPIQGDMVHPYLRRRQGLEAVNYPSQELEEVLGKTLGVPLFQEQAMRIAIVAAGFTPAEADKLRRAMATFRKVGTIGSFQQKMVEGMAARGYDRDFAERCFRQIEGFGEYGFPESHAASFALLVYVSAWLKCHYPDAFAVGLLNAQPMGFYAPAQIVRDAREHGVEVRATDINHSAWASTLEPGLAAGPRVHRRHAAMAGVIKTTHALRLGLHQITGLREDAAAAIVAHRGRGYDSVRDLWLRTGLSPAVLERLADADAFRSIGLDRRDALWAVRGLMRAGDKDDLPLFSSGTARALEPDVTLPAMALGEHVVEDYRHLKLSLKSHPLALLRTTLDARRISPCDDLTQTPSGRRVTVAGLVTVRQRPGTASGVIFMTLEDETAVANIVVWPKIFETFRPVVLGARLISVTGVVQSDQGVIHVIANRLDDLTGILGQLAVASAPITSLARADEVRRTPHDPKAKRLTHHAASVPSLFEHAAGLTAEHARDIDPRDTDTSAAAVTDKASQDKAWRAMPGGRNFH